MSEAIIKNSSDTTRVRINGDEYINFESRASASADYKPHASIAYDNANSDISIKPKITIESLDPTITDTTTIDNAEIQIKSTTGSTTNTTTINSTQIESGKVKTNAVEPMDTTYPNITLDSSISGDENISLYYANPSSTDEPRVRITSSSILTDSTFKSKPNSVLGTKQASVQLTTGIKSEVLIDADKLTTSSESIIQSAAKTVGTDVKQASITLTSTDSNNESSIKLSADNIVLNGNALNTNVIQSITDSTLTNASKIELLPGATLSDTSIIGTAGSVSFVDPTDSTNKTIIEGNTITANSVQSTTNSASDVKAWVELVDGDPTASPAEPPKIIIHGRLVLTDGMGAAT